MYYLWGHPERNPLLIFQYLENFGIELGDQILPLTNVDDVNLTHVDIKTILEKSSEKRLPM